MPAITNEILSSMNARANRRAILSRQELREEMIIAGASARDLINVFGY